METKRIMPSCIALVTALFILLIPTIAKAVEVSGTLHSAETPTTPVVGATVSIPSIEVSAITNLNGEFDLGDVPEGTYSFEVSFDPAGSAGYHNQVYQSLPVSASFLELTVHEILAPQDISASALDSEILLAWSAPENHDPLTPGLITDRLHRLDVLQKIMEERGETMSVAEKQSARFKDAEQEIARQIYRLDVMSGSEYETDAIEDFGGYRIRLNGELLPDVITDTRYRLGGLTNGQLYEIEIATDYGYGDDVLVFSPLVSIRPLPEDYEWGPVSYDWIELNPSAGGSGTAVSWQTQYTSSFFPVQESGFIGMGNLEFSFYGETYNRFNISEKGWISFTYSGVDDRSFNVPLWVPREDSGPYNYIAPFTGSWAAASFGGDFTSWYSIDEANERVVIEWHVTHSVFPGFDAIFELILECSTNEITFSYNNANNFSLEYLEYPWYFVEPSMGGIENRDGTKGILFPWRSIQNNTSFRFSPMLNQTYGNLIGTVTDGENPVEGAYVLVKELGIGTFTDATGSYVLNSLDRSDAPFTLIIRANDYQEKQIENVVFSNLEIFDEVVDVILDPVGNDVAPSVIGANGDHDHGVDVYLSRPGTFLDYQTFKYDNGVTGARQIATKAAGDETIFAVPFWTNGPTFISRALILSDFYGNDKSHFAKDTYDPVIVKIYADDHGLPGEILFTSQPTTNIAGEQWIVVYPNVATPSSGFWVAYHAVGDGYNCMCFDEESDFPLLLFTGSDDSNWERFVWDYRGGLGGDPMVRADVLLLNGAVGSGTPILIAPEQQGLSLKEAPESGRKGESSGKQRVSLIEKKPGVYVSAPPMLSGFTSLDALPPLNAPAVNGYNLFYSVNGGFTFEKSNDALIESDVAFLEVGSEYEGEAVLIYATAELDTGEGVIETKASATRVCKFGLPPSPPDGLTIQSNGFGGQGVLISWNAPTTNSDGSTLTDLAGYRVFRNGEPLATIIGGHYTSLDDTPPTAGYYKYSVVAYDDQDNLSAVAVFEEEYVLVGTPDYICSFESGEDNVFLGNGCWERGTPQAGPSAAFEGDAVWATTLNGNYSTEISTLESQFGFLITSENAQLAYHHWCDYPELSGVEMYRLEYSIDGGTTWNVRVPRNLSGIDADWFDGITGSSGGWVPVVYDLGDLLIPSQPTEVRLAFRHFPDPWVTPNNYGVAIDALQLFGIAPIAFGGVEGTVFESGSALQAEDVVVTIPGYLGVLTSSDASGSYSLEHILAAQQTVRFDKEGFWPQVESITVVADQTITHDVELTYPEALLDTDLLKIQLPLSGEPDSMATGYVTITAGDNGKLDWKGNVSLVGDGNNQTPVHEGVYWGDRLLAQPRGIEKPDYLGDWYDMKSRTGHSGKASGGLPGEPWTPITQFEINSKLDDPYAAVFGVAVGDEAIYITTIYGLYQLVHFDFDGNVVETHTFPDYMIDYNLQAAILDLAIDPVSGYLYGGTPGGEIYRFLPDLTDVAMVADLDVEVTGIALDWNNNHLYCYSWETEEFFRVDAATGTVQNLTLAMGINTILAVGYMPVDPEGYTVWLLGRPSGMGAELFKYNPVTQLFTGSTQVYENDISGGMEISDSYNAESWDIAIIRQDVIYTTQYFDLYEGYPATGPLVWIEPASGTLGAGESQTIAVHSDLRNAPVGSYNLGDVISAQVSFSGPFLANPPELSVEVSIVEYSGVPETKGLPLRYALHQGYPNPFNPTVTVPFDLAADTWVSIEVYNVLGELVATLVDQRMSAGQYKAVWSADRQPISSGVYLVKMVTPNFNTAQKIILMK